MKKKLGSLLLTLCMLLALLPTSVLAADPANPAVTIARSLTDTYSGILWTGTPAFIFFQILGTLVAVFVVRRMSPRETEPSQF